MKQHKKVDVAAKLAARPLKYNLMVGYDPILETEVSLVLQNNHLKTKIITETYFYMKDLTKEEAERIKKLIQDVKFEFKSPKTGNLRTFKVRYISATLAPEFNLGKLKRINKKKVERAQLLLCTTDSPVKEIAFATGFSDQSYFIRLFRKICGVTPQEYRLRMRASR